MTKISSALGAWIAEGPTDAEVNGLLREIAEIIIQPLPVMTGHETPYDDRGLKLLDWFRHKASSSCTRPSRAKILELALGCDPDEVFVAIKTHFPGVLPKDAELEWRRPTNFFSL